MNSTRDNKAVDEPTSPGIPEKSPSYRAQAVTASLLSLIVALWVPSRGPVETTKNLAALPSSIGEWVEESRTREQLIAVQNADQQILKVYRNRDGIRMRLLVAYFETQCEGKEVVNSLLTPLSQPLRRIELTSGKTGRISLNQSAVKDLAGQEYRLFFWYDLNGRIVTSKLGAKIATIWDALVRGRTNGALVIIYSEGLRSRAQEARFIGDLIQVLRQYLP